MKFVDIPYLSKQFHRKDYCLLNGIWNLVILNELDNKIYEGKVNVPFGLETEDSGVNHILLKNEIAIYSLDFEKIDLKEDETCLLHFLAVDQIAEVTLNGINIGIHEGGYTPFEFDIGEHLKENNHLEVRVKDYTMDGPFSYGKQKIKRGGIWYTPTSGIIQDVYLEKVKKNRITSIKVTPNVDGSNIELIVKTTSADKKCFLRINSNVVSCETDAKNVIAINNPNYWSPEKPYLYRIEVLFDKDIISSYFGFRKIEVKKDSQGIERVYLNNKPIFLSGLLDQGYYSSGYTAKDKEEYENDIKLIKKYGFNTLRKHIKLEHPYFYYLCDKYGVLVIQDFINGGSKYKFRVITVPALLPIKYDDTKYKAFGRLDEQGREFYKKESENIIDVLYNHPSVVVYTVFNEAWGQFDSKKMTEYFKGLDSTRLYDSTSGWHDTKSGNFISRHVYFKKFKLKLDGTSRAFLLSEFGGYGLKINGHTFGEAYFCYKKTKDKKHFKNSIYKLYSHEIIPAIKKGLCGSIYTQLADVEDELNGLVTFDRKEKITDDTLKKINLQIEKEMKKIN